MIQITAQMRVLVAIEPVDGRKGMDSLARLCQEKLANKNALWRGSSGIIGKSKPEKYLRGDLLRGSARLGGRAP
jgi:hypothetical protein